MATGRVGDTWDRLGAGWPPTKASTSLVNAAVARLGGLLRMPVFGRGGRVSPAGYRWWQPLRPAWGGTRVGELGQLLRRVGAALLDSLHRLAALSPYYLVAAQRVAVWAVVAATLAMTVGGIFLAMASVTRAVATLLCGDGPCSE